MTKTLLCLFLSLVFVASTWGYGMPSGNELIKMFQNLVFYDSHDKSFILEDVIGQNGYEDFVNAMCSDDGKKLLTKYHVKFRCE